MKKSQPLRLGDVFAAPDTNLSWPIKWPARVILDVVMGKGPSDIEVSYAEWGADFGHWVRRCSLQTLLRRNAKYGLTRLGNLGTEGSEMNLRDFVEEILWNVQETLISRLPEEERDALCSEDDDVVDAHIRTLVLNHGTLANQSAAHPGDGREKRNLKILPPQKGLKIS